jgi:hypothetical protein
LSLLSKGSSNLVLGLLLESENFKFLLSNIDLVCEDGFFGLSAFSINFLLLGLGPSIIISGFVVGFALGGSLVSGFIIGNSTGESVSLGLGDGDFSVLLINLVLHCFALVEISGLVCCILSDLGKSACLSGSCSLKRNLTSPFSKFLSLQFEFSLPCCILLSNLF